MTAPIPDPMTLPTRRTCPFDPPDEYARLRAERPLSRLRLPGGRLGWLLTRYEDARVTLADPRLRPPVVQITPATELPLPEEELQIPPGTFSALDPPEHTRYRKLVNHYFTRKRVRDLEPRIAQIVDEQLTAMIRGGCPADLQRQFADTVPAVLVTEMLGIPASACADYQRWATTVLSTSANPDQLRSARTGIYGGLAELVESKRARPGTDIVSDLLRATPLSATEITNIAALLLVTGLETTAYMIGLGTFTLLRHPDQLAAIRADETLLDGAVEELLRYLTIVQFGITRTAREDLEIAGQPIRAGETVIISIASANRDPDAFAEPDRLDVRRHDRSHLAFGHGAHLCLGAQLARAELRIGWRALFRRLPGLRLAVPAEQVAMGDDRVHYGVRALPVEWDGA